MESKDRTKLVDFVNQLVGLLSAEEKQGLINGLISQDQPGIPLSIFKNKQLSGLEAIVLYLRQQNQTISQISSFLNRKPSTIYTTYNNARKKFTTKLIPSKTSFLIPLKIFSDRKFSILESLIHYLKIIHHLPLTKVAILLDKNYNTIKTVYRRYNQKCQ